VAPLVREHTLRLELVCVIQDLHSLVRIVIKILRHVVQQHVGHHQVERVGVLAVV
jgi:hypothetical protein